MQGTQFDLYYGGAYFQRNAFTDVTSPLVIQPMVGFGGTNSANNNNRFIQEVSGDLTQDIWADPTYGVCGSQASSRICSETPGSFRPARRCMRAR